MKPPESVAAQRIPAVLPAISALADAHGAADLLGYDDPPKAVDSADYPGSFHYI